MNGHPAIMFQHRSSPFQLDKPHDPREQDVAEKPLTRALTGSADPDICTACGVPVRLHFGVTGVKLGCDVAQYVRRQSSWPRNPERWNDPYTPITTIVRAAMVDGTCGPTLEIQMAGYTNDEQLTIAATLTRIVIAEYVKGLSK